MATNIRNIVTGYNVGGTATLIGGGVSPGWTYNYTSSIKNIFVAGMNSWGGQYINWTVSQNAQTLFRFQGPDGYIYGLIVISGSGTFTLTNSGGVYNYSYIYSLN